MTTGNQEGVGFTLASVPLLARASGALWWPGPRLLAVADLHLGKPERGARQRGILLPPYADRETLARLRAEIDALDPAVVVVVGDAFDDMAASAGIGAEERGLLGAMMAGRRWVWVAGNHDPAPVALGGECATQFHLAPLSFRHIATAAPWEISGHYHPKAMIRSRGRRLSRPCMAFDSRRVILPAFGAFTGGLDVAGPVLDSLLGVGAQVVLTGRRARAVSLAALRR